MHEIPMERLPGRRRWTLVYETGEDVITQLGAFADREGVRAAHFTALGALRTATLAYYDWETKEYQEIPVDEQVEVTSLVGDVGVEDDSPAIHAHAVLGHRDGRAVTGHLVRGSVRPTLELFIEEGERPLHRRADAASGLTLIRP